MKQFQRTVTDTDKRLTDLEKALKRVQRLKKTHAKERLEQEKIDRKIDAFLNVIGPDIFGK